MMIKKYSLLKRVSVEKGYYEGLDLDSVLDRFYEVSESAELSNLKPKNNNKLIAYQWIRQWGVKEHPTEGEVEVSVSDFTRAQHCTNCGKAIVHVFWVLDESGKVRPYGSEHLHKALGLSSPINKTKADKIIMELQYKEKVKKERKKELLEKASPDIIKVNSYWRVLGDNNPFRNALITPFGGKPYLTIVLEKEGKYIRVVENSEDQKMMECEGFTRVSEKKNSEVKG